MSSRVKLTITCIHEEKIKFDDLSRENNYKYRFIVSSNWIDRRFEFENFDPSNESMQWIIYNCNKLNNSELKKLIHSIKIFQKITQTYSLFKLKN